MECRQRLTQITDASKAVAAAMAQADEMARQADVYPGVRRDLREKYELVWVGWER
jgi:hypothetical protein